MAIIRIIESEAIAELRRFNVSEDQRNLSFYAINP